MKTVSHYIPRPTTPLVAALAWLMCGNIVRAGAPPITVTNVADSGPGSLRQALADAAVQGGADTITFSPALSGQTITTTSGEMVIADTAGVTVDATALPAGLTVSGNNSSRIFSVSSGASLTLAGLRLTGGNGTGAASSGSGGAIYSGGSLFLNRCTLAGCTASGAGGGVCHTGATLALAYCTVSGNSAVGGGGIHNSSLTAGFTLTQCTFFGNTATNGGGGGLVSASSVTLAHCTLSGNTASGLIGRFYYGGGGLQAGISALVTLDNSIIAGNSLASGSTGRDVITNGFVFRQGANIVPALVIEGHGGTVSGPGTISTAAPLLAPPGSYGGPTQTMALLPGSPARNAAVGSTITSDQRGFPIVGTPDIGAYEAGTLAANYNAYIYETLPAAATPAGHAETVDFDGDGQTNFDEFSSLTNAASGGSFFTLSSSQSGGNMAISFTSAPGRTYRLRQSDDLGQWTDAPAGLISGDGGVKTFSVPVDAARRWFRVLPAAPTQPSS